jgi:hypothetical protein
MAKGSQKSNKNRKPQVHVRFTRVLIIISGFNMLLLFAPGFGLLHPFYYIGDYISFGSSILGAVLVYYGFKSLYYKDEKKKSGA